MPGFRAGKAPAIVRQDKPVTTKMGINADRQLVIIEYDRSLNNVQMTLEQVNSFIDNLIQCRIALMDVQSKAAAKQDAKG